TRFDALSLLARAYEGSASIKERERCVAEMETLAEGLTDEERFIAATARGDVSSWTNDLKGYTRGVEGMLRAAHQLNDRRKTARAFDAAGSRSWLLGRNEEAYELFDRALQAAHAAKDAPLISRIHVNFALALFSRGYRERAFAMLEEARNDERLQDD